MNPLNGVFSLILLAWALPGLAQAGKPVLAPQPTTPPAPSAAETAATPTTTPAAPAMVGADYLIGPDDSLQVSVAEDPHLTGAVLVRPDGKISLAMVGDVPAAGLTPVQLAADISERVKKYVKDPTVTVAVLSINSKQVILVGEVARVGPLPIRPNMTVLQAIVTAGGLTPFANKKKIYVLRGEPGKQQRIPFNYKKSLTEDDMLVKPGDRIVVPD
jgi:polysaccharide biosynthesis/export protein